MNRLINNGCGLYLRSVFSYHRHVPCIWPVRSITRDVRQPTHFSHPELFTNESEIIPGITQQEFAGRRRRLMEEIGRSHTGMSNSKHVVIIPAAHLRYMSHDVFYRFHQHNDFLYLTGFQEADAVLILETNDSIKLPDHKAILYTTPRNPYKEKWEGPLMGPDDAVDFLGVDEAYSLNLFAEHLEERFSKYDYSVWYYGGEQLPRIVDYSIDVIINDHLLHGINSQIKSVHSPLPLLQHLRATKSGGEIKLMLKAGEIAAKSFKKAMSVTRPGMYEYQLESHFEHSCRMEGAQRMSFVPVVAGGHRGCHLHYTTNEQKLNDGQLVLMDAGAEYFGYVSDVTRTWPVNGSFTAAQKDLYEAILRVKNACIESCQSGITLNYLQALSKELLVMELKSILPMSLVGSGLYSVLNGLYPHDLGHYLGLDVHDTPTLSHNVPLQPGMVITVEPGIYIRRDFPIKDPVRAKEFQGLAIRLEDNILITNEGPQILNEGTPESIQDVTKLIK